MLTMRDETGLKRAVTTIKTNDSRVEKFDELCHVDSNAYNENEDAMQRNPLLGLDIQIPA